jgi:hypothetical protein
MQVQRFFHIRAGDRGGATVLVTGDTEKVGHVSLRVAFCSPKDQFCRKTGRLVAHTAPEQIVPLRYLPNRMTQVVEKVEKRTRRCVYPHSFEFAIKYFLPKGE